MIDPKFIRENPDAIRKAFTVRRMHAGIDGQSSNVTDELSSFWSIHGNRGPLPGEHYGPQSAVR
ncbi:MAG: hypothetical protein U0163_21170 [Gemmatimonadaceae bacterium]